MVEITFKSLHFLSRTNNKDFQFGTLQGFTKTVSGKLLAFLIFTFFLSVSWPCCTLQKLHVLTVINSFPFQVVADRIGIGCSLVRGEYNRAWNEVELVDDSPQGIAGLLLPPQVYIVDLMFEPGFLMKQGSAEADQYKHI